MYYDSKFAKIVQKILKGGGIGVTRTITKPNNTRSHEIKQTFLKNGWDQEYVSRTFANLTDSILAKYTTQQFIVAWAHSMIAALKDVTNLQACLQTIGLRPDVAAYLMKIIGPLVNTSYTNHQLLDVAIEHLLKEKHPRLDAQPNHFLLAYDKANTWFRIDGSKVSFINISGPCSNSRVDEIHQLITRIPKNMNIQTKLFYHTTSWYGCKNILKGVNHSEGRICTDFGIQPSFYVSETVSDCVGWGDRNRENYSGQVGILIFALPKTLPKSLIVCELTGSRWTDITQKSRQCANTSTELKELEECHFVYGNMVANPSAIRYRGATPKTHTPPLKQLASKTTEADEYLHSCIIGCLFFEEQPI